jgi:hypothetical protein
MKFAHCPVPSSEKWSRTRRRVSILNILGIVKPDVLFLVLCLPLIFIGLNTTRDLEWPYDLDHYRDIAQTQTILDGGYGSDPYYLNEYIWYNPGSHFVIGVLSLLFNMGIPETIVRVGPFLNLLPLIAFCIMMRIIFGWPTALISTMAYLLIPNNCYPVWCSSLYSPWFYPSTFSQAFFYITVTLFYIALKKSLKTRYYVIVGFLLGVTFLFHTAPAFIGFGLITICFLGKMGVKLKNRQLIIDESKSLLRKFLCLVIPALIISMIFIYFIIWHYQLKILNPLPCSWLWDQLTFEKLPSLLQKEFLHLFSLIAAFGLVHLISSKKDIAARNILLSWLVFCLACAGCSILKSNLESLNSLPSIIPAHHFFFYLKTLSYVFFGFGAVCIGQILRKLLKNNRLLMKKIKPHLLNIPFQSKTKLVVYVIITALLTLYILYVYPGNKNLYETRNACLSRMSQTHLIDLYYWVRQNTRKDDVFLCSNKFGMKAVVPAGRKVVATHICFSNPFVDYKKRNGDREKMMENLKSGGILSFFRLCVKYKVKYVIAETPVFTKANKYFMKHLKKVFQSGNVVVARINFDQRLRLSKRTSGEPQKDGENNDN